MPILKQFLSIAACTLLTASVALAITPQQQSGQDSANSKPITITTEQQSVRFVAPSASLEVRLEVFNQTGELIYDSGPVSGHELSWNMHNASGEAVPSGFYGYKLSIKEATADAPSMRRGHLIVERASDRDTQIDRLWVTSDATLGSDTTLTGGDLTVASAPETSAIGKETKPGVSTQSVSNLTGFGTTGRLPKFGGGDFLVNSIVQELTGKISVGGQVESTTGGFKFPDGTVQLTSAATALFQVQKDQTLKGDGTAANPLGVAVPLILTGAVDTGNGVITVTNTAAGAPAIFGVGGNSSPTIGGGSGLIALGGSGTSAPGGAGIVSFGGNANGGSGGTGASLIGGVGSNTGNGGDGLFAVGALGTGTGKKGGRGLIAIAGGGAQGAIAGLAGEFIGDVEISGNLSKGAGSFKIDHPLDPENKYLYHSFVESPDMKNIYDGTVLTDANGDATVTLPAYMEALNDRFRYQLTVIGTFAQAIVASEIKDNKFAIKTSAANVKVSWMVTGVRKDPYAQKFRIPVEEAKPQKERGFYLHPAAYNQPDEKSVAYARKKEN